MTHTTSAIAALTAAQDAFEPIAIEFRHAREALKRSKSKANVARYDAAVVAFDAGLEACDRAHAAVEAAEAIDGALAAQVVTAERRAAEPTLL